MRRFFVLTVLAIAAIPLYVAAQSPIVPDSSFGIPGITVPPAITPPVLPVVQNQTQKDGASTARASYVRVLMRGMRGADVSSLQEKLIALNMLSSDSATGYFGALTEAAVKAFQKNTGIVSSGTAATTGYGVVGPKTRAKIILQATSGIQRNNQNSNTSQPTPANGGGTSAQNVPTGASVASGGTNNQSGNQSGSATESTSQGASGLEQYSWATGSGVSPSTNFQSGTAVASQGGSSGISSGSRGIAVGTHTTPSSTVMQQAGKIPLDVFLVAGQSNALGVGDAALSPVPQTGKVLQYVGGQIKDAKDPVGYAYTGSAWPSFGIEYFKRTGRIVAFVPTAAGTTAQAAAADTGAGNWDDGGTLFNASITTLNEAFATFSSAGYQPVLKGVLWAQGENDAYAINAGKMTVTTYANAFLNMINKYRVAKGVSLPVYIFRLGAQPASADAGWAQIREAQEHINANVVFCNAVDFPSRNMMESNGGPHYTQAGYNEMGTIGARNIVLGNFGCAPFYADNTSIRAGQSTYLHVYVPGASSCILSGAGYGGGQSVSVPAWGGWSGVLTQTTQFSLECLTPSGAQYFTTTVTVQ